MKYFLFALTTYYCALSLIMADCDKCYKRIYGSFVDHEAMCCQIGKASDVTSSSKRKSTTTSSHSRTSSLLYSRKSGSASQNPSPIPLLNLTPIDAYRSIRSSSISTFKKRKGTSKEVIQGDVISPDLNKSTASTHIYDTDGLTAITFANFDSTNTLLSSPFYLNASEDSRRKMMTNVKKQQLLKNTKETLSSNGSTLNPTFEGNSMTSPMDSEKLCASNTNNDVDINNDRRSSNGRSLSISPQDHDKDESPAFDNNNYDNGEITDNDHPGLLDCGTEIDATNRQPPIPPSEVHTIIDTMKKQNQINGVLFGPKELASLQLHSILDKANVPKYLFDQIADWGFKNDLRKSGVMKRTQLINNMKTKMQMPDIYPKRVVVGVDKNHFEVITKFDFKNNLYSLLTDPELMRPENLIFGDKPLEPPVFEPGDDEPLCDINSCEWFHATYMKMVTDPRMQMLCPIIIFEDETYQDTKGALKFHLITFTLGIFNRETRARPEAWRHLGFIPKAKNCQPEGSKVKDTSRRKCIDHHVFIAEILAGFKDAQAEQPLPWKFGDTAVEMFIPLMYSIGDIAGQDKL